MTRGGCRYLDWRFSNDGRFPEIAISSFILLWVRKCLRLHFAISRAEPSLLAGVKPRVHHVVATRGRTQDPGSRIGVLEMSPAASNAANLDLPIGLCHRPRDGSVV